ncbi:MAG: septum formation protein Maf [Bacteroidetes bacterium]|uniref:dTTP/UTP pyrophosphatase n=1 Tax=Candidatus Enterocola intestinipullorum TaxID=2840783 RepID=A0A9D9EIK2_9BACT|nr:septum formation protein Maf [Candidatus Enterocola intestinipullorum]
MLLTEKLKNYNVILASASPRRRELLQGLEFDFTCKPVDIDESYPPNLEGAQIPLYIADKKADAYLPEMKDNDLVITADTVVIADDFVLGKPADLDEARKMLQLLSGHTHKVITGICLTTKSKRRSFHSMSEVTFTELSEEEINHYLQTYKPLDKAGAYGVQEWIGFIGIEKLVGSFYNVMGLPVHRLYRELNAFL